MIFMNDMHYTLITGGSNGIGKAFAFECAKRKMNILLVALPGPELEETANQIKKIYNVSTDFLAIDLTEEKGPQNVYEWVKKKDYTVTMLINNAGIAGASDFTESTLKYNELRIQLNIRALVLLIRLFLPDLLKLDSGIILNVGSLSAYYPIGYKAVYAASKAFVLNFSLGLREELRNTSVSITVVCPNGVRTNKGTLARLESHGWKGRLSEVPAEYIARLSMDKALRGKSVVIPGWFSKFLLFLSVILPRKLQIRIATREMKKEISLPPILRTS
jgi:short-subunit dehydrogenase